MVHCSLGWPATAGSRGHARRMCCLIMVTLSSAGFASGARAQAQANYQALETFTSLLNVIRSEYVDSLTLPQLVRAAMEGVVQSLDPYSRLVPRDMVAREVALERGDLGTLGMNLEAVDGLPTVLSVVDGGPAERSGVSAGDRVVSINDSSVAGSDVGALVLEIARPPGTRVTLGMERGPRMQPEGYRVTIQTAVVRARSVTLARMLDGGIGYVRLADFRPGAPEELADAVERLRRRHATGLLLDLRGNPGGRVTASVEVAALFLPRRTVVFRTRGRRTEDRDYATLVDGPFRSLPLVVLTDAHTASAAEALTGSFQDHNRALVVGERTFGKALILEPFVLPNGDVVWLTAGWVLTPNGRFIQRPYVTSRPAQRRVVGVPSRDSAVERRRDAGRHSRGAGASSRTYPCQACRSLPYGSARRWTVVSRWR
jgi:carboxyl-terminal processing protease